MADLLSDGAAVPIFMLMMIIMKMALITTSSMLALIIVVLAKLIDSVTEDVSLAMTGVK